MLITMTLRQNQIKRRKEGGKRRKEGREGGRETRNEEIYNTKYATLPIIKCEIV